MWPVSPTFSSEPLSTIALWNRPLADGMAISVETFAPPPDWPKMVTLVGSPPKAAMLSRTHSSAGHQVELPTLPERP